MEDCVIGIDVGKYELVIYWNGKYHTVNNEPSDLKGWLKKYITDITQVKLIVFEPTGGYERNVKTCLRESNIPYRMVHANHVRDHARSLGIYAKTDKIDAKILVDFAISKKIEARVEIEEYPRLKVLLTRREQLIDMRLQERNRLDKSDKLLVKFINKHITNLTKLLAEIEKAIETELRKNEALQEQFDLYSSVPGIGMVTGLQLIVDLPELRIEDDKRLAALVGIAPYNKDSGTRIGRRRTRGGRSRIRSLLYMAALVAARCDPTMKKFYKKLRDKGKAPKVALIAVAHKLLILLRCIAQRQSPWVPHVT
jgi:transposase